MQYWYFDKTLGAMVMSWLYCFSVIVFDDGDLPPSIEIPLNLFFTITSFRTASFINICITELVVIIVFLA